MGCGGSKAGPGSDQPRPRADARGTLSLSFVEFPTPKLLRESNEEFHRVQGSLPRSLGVEIEPYPPRLSKRDVFDPAAYKVIDSRAISAPTSLVAGDIKSLVEYLVRDVTTELGRVRSIFRWITAQDMTSLTATKSTGIKQATVGWDLWAVANNFETYTELFMKLCRAADIRCKEIKGYTKVRHDDLDVTALKAMMGCWAAVCIDGQWRLVNPRWAAQHSAGEGPGEWKLIDKNGKGAKETIPRSTPNESRYVYDETYFLTDPEQLIYHHLPDEEDEWQLLARPVTLNEFKDMACLYQGFFDLGLELKEERKYVLHAPEGVIEIQIGVPESRMYSFMYMMWKSTKDGRNLSTVENCKLERFVLMQQKPGVLTFRIQFPMSGKYKFDLFGSEGKSTCHVGICTYVIICDKPMDNCRPLPENARREWGPGVDLLEAGLEAVSHPDATVEAEQGVAKIRFKTIKDVEILHDLHSNTMSTDSLENNVTHYFRDGECVVDVKLPESGDYALNLHAKEAGTDGNFSNVCSYVVSSAAAALDPTPFPSVAGGMLGALADNNTYKLKPISHPNPVIEVTDDGELEVVFETPNAVELLGNLELQTMTETTEEENYVFISQEGNRAVFKLRFPKAGCYGFEICAKAANAPGSYDYVFNYLVKVAKPTANRKPFPETYASWGAAYDVIEPTSGVLPRNQNIRFVAKIPGVAGVAAICGKKWTHLKQGEDGMWTGDVETAEGTQLTLSAKLDGKSNSYDALLKYQIAKAETDQSECDAATLAIKEADDRRAQALVLEKEREGHFQTAAEALRTSLKARDLQTLCEAVKLVESQRFVTRLREEMDEAKALMKSLGRIKALRLALLKVNQGTILEIRNYVTPPPAVHDVMVATLLLLGFHERRTRDWIECQKLCKPTELMRRVKSFDVIDLKPEISSRTYDILRHFRLDDVSAKSAGAAAFYEWACGMVQEERLQHPTDGRGL